MLTKKTALGISLLMVMAIAVTAAAPAGQRGKTVPREISGVMDGRFGFEGPWEGPWTTTGDVAGTLRHLGMAELLTTHTADPNGTISGGTFTIVAANGDEIQGTYSASGDWLSDTQVLGSATLLIEGGTGRFADASGTIDAAFLETFDDLTFASAGVTWTLDGTVYY